MRTSPVSLAVAGLLVGLFGASPSVNRELAPWQRREMSDPLRGTKFSQFSLDGKFLTPPRDKPNATPTMIVRCISGKGNHGHRSGEFLNGYVHVGGVGGQLDPHCSNTAAGLYLHYYEGHVVALWKIVGKS